MRSCHILLMGVLLVLLLGLGGCAPNSPPEWRRCDLLLNVGFDVGVSDCVRLQHEPLSTQQFVAFVGDPDLSVSWAKIEETLAHQPGMSGEALEIAMRYIRTDYAFAKDINDDFPVMEGVDVWLYMWNKPVSLVVCCSGKSAGVLSLAVLVENGHVLGISSIGYGN
jgi:hypothetical protein